MKGKKRKNCKKKEETRCVISIYFVHAISFPHVLVFFFKFKMSKFRVRFDTMLLCEKFLSISV